MSLTAIRVVEPGSPAHKAGVQVGEVLTHVNGKPIVDVLDYKFYSYDTKLELTLRAPDNSFRTVSVRKREGQDLGLEFETYLMDRARSCANNCIFCFVDQMPPGMRKSLYFKDDDARLSFLCPRSGRNLGSHSHDVNALVWGVGRRVFLLLFRS